MVSMYYASPTMHQLILQEAEEIRELDQLDMRIRMDCERSWYVCSWGSTYGCSSVAGNFCIKTCK